jgi:hypothetical protein
MPLFPTRRPAVVALLVALLAGAQLAALGAQWRAGFRPFVHEPGRVPLSWDMFAVRIERCDVAWAPSLPVDDGPPIARMSERARPLEWFAVYDTRESYRAVGLQGCSLARPGTRVTLSCHLPDGTSAREAFDCP